ncbi:amidohydrolase [Solimonas variicoloris]|uniref:amidohydrolase n=1 Tax=Solimonas variicoloris TaxID=254408 RepID=UPI000368FE9B|nr:amidohydrolase [Solimonas variicoloris]
MSALLIHGATVLTVNASDEVIADGAVLVEDGRIADIGPSAALLQRWPGVDRHDARGQVLLPGLVNLHLHSGLIRGTAEDMPVFAWLARHVDPKHRVLSADDAYAASRLCYAEALLSGTTTVLDMYRYMHRCADAAEQLGLRAVLAPYVADQPPYTYFETLEANARLVEERHGSAQGRVRVWFGLEHLTYCTEAAFREAARLAEHYGVGIHTHGEESREMASRLHAETGLWPIELFHERGILGPRTVLAHCVWLQPQEIEILARTGTSVAHCPVSNMKLASGICPVPELLDAGVAVGIGSDGVKENNNLDLLEEMKFVPLLQKVRLLDARAMPAPQVLRMATIDGARALGLDDEIGSLERGKKADLILVDFMRPHLTPVLHGAYGNVVSNLVYAARGSDVRLVMVDGQVLVRDGVLLRADVNELMRQAQQATEALIVRREPYVPTIEGC